MANGHTLPIFGQKTSLKAVTSGKEVAAFVILGAENIIAEIINRTYVRMGGSLPHPQSNRRATCYLGKTHLRVIGWQNGRI